MGDWNTAHTELDLARPRDNRRNSGFLPEERAAFQRWIDAGFVDTFRHFEPGGGHYTWWRQWGDARERNVGWRIDYVLASAAARRTRLRWACRDVVGSAPSTTCFSRVSKICAAASIPMLLFAVVAAAPPRPASLSTRSFSSAWL